MPCVAPKPERATPQPSRFVGGSEEKRTPGPLLRARFLYSPNLMRSFPSLYLSPLYSQDLLTFLSHMLFIFPSSPTFLFSLSLSLSSYALHIPMLTELSLLSLLLCSLYSPALFFSLSLSPYYSPPSIPVLKGASQKGFLIFLLQCMFCHSLQDNHCLKTDFFCCHLSLFLSSLKVFRVLYSAVIFKRFPSFYLFSMCVGERDINQRRFQAG